MRNLVKLIGGKRRAWFGRMLPALFLCAASAANGAELSLTPYAAEYKVKISVLSGKLATELRRTELGYSAVSTIRPSGVANVFLNGVIEESSWFTVADSGVVPGGGS